jgi:hypothetical protein
LLVKEQKIVSFDAQVCAAATQARQRAYAFGLRRSDIENAEALAFEARSRFMNPGGLDCAGHNLAARRP